MIILGIDPGYAIVGWGVIEYKNSVHTPVAFGAITTEAHTDFNMRLRHIYDDTVELISKAKPDAISIEKLYFNTNTTSRCRSRPPSPATARRSSRRSWR